MALYLISYDINEKDEFEYEPLWQRLKDIGANGCLLQKITEQSRGRPAVL